MIRFVAAPDGTVVPDLKGRLPGRGCWVTATRDHVARATAMNLFARRLKTAVKPAADLPAQVEALLADAALGALAMARKAGALVSGAAKVDGAVRTNAALAVIHASDAAPDGVRKIEQAARAVGHMGGEPVHRFQPFAGAELAAALGLDNPVHLALTVAGRGTGAAEAAVARLEALAIYRGDHDPPAGAGESEADA